MTGWQEQRTADALDTTVQARSRRWKKAWQTGGAVAAGAVLAGLTLQIPGVQDFGIQLIGDLAPGHAPGFDMASCRVDATKVLPPNGDHAAKIARLLHIPIVQVGNTDMYSAACPTDISRAVRQHGTEIGEYTVHPTHETGTSYEDCVIFGIKRQTDHALQAHSAPMILDCKSVTQVFAYA